MTKLSLTLVQPFEQTLSCQSHRWSMQRRNSCLLEDMKAQGSKRMGVPSPHLWHTKWLGFNGPRKGDSEEKKAQKPHSTERGSGTRVFISCETRCFAPNPPTATQTPPQGDRRRARCDTATHDGGRPAEAQQGMGGLAESPTGPRLV